MGYSRQMPFEHIYRHHRRHRITEGAEEASIKSGLRGFIVDYNRVGARFIMRKPGWMFLSRSKNTLRYDKSRIRQDMAVRFVFVNGPDCDYASLASKYSEYLTKKLSVEKTMGEPPINIRIFCEILICYYNKFVGFVVVSTS